MPFFKFNRRGRNPSNWVARIKATAAAKKSALQDFFAGNNNPSSYAEVATTLSSS
jgi:hypothetical protein